MTSAAKTNDAKSSQFGEQSTKCLAELGFLAKLQLDKSSQQVSDPEVKRRIDALLGSGCFSLLEELSE